MNKFLTNGIDYNDVNLLTLLILVFCVNTSVVQAISDGAAFKKTIKIIKFGLFSIYYDLLIKIKRYFFATEPLNFPVWTKQRLPLILENALSDKKLRINKIERMI